MKKVSIIFFLVVATVLVMSCGQDNRKPAAQYMPDMAYSRAYETYADHGNLAQKGIHYNATPVAGTVSREEAMPYHLPNDADGYAQSASIKNPIDSLSENELKETERLYLINCGICHGDKLDGNGPLYKGGEGPYAAKPAQLVGDPLYMEMTDGTMFHSITYGKNLMGSYASQLSKKQRWQIVKYIKMKQA
jgi:hypothetical protein